MTNEAAKPNCVLPIGDDSSMYEDCLSSKLMVMIINETKLSWRQELCQKCEHWQSYFNFRKNDYLVSLFLEKQLASQYMFLVESELSINTYLFLVFYKSTSL